MSAYFSACGCYRYSLDRVTGASPRFRRRRAAVVMVNPSRANAIENDQTIRKVTGFMLRADVGLYTVGNLFAWCATDVRELRRVPDPVGPMNDAILCETMGRADLIVVAWGASGKLPGALRDRWRRVVALAGEKPLHCLGTAGDGHPLHPLMLGYATPLRPWSPPL